jgi:flagellar biosynthetic protein FlhB
MVKQRLRQAQREMAMSRAAAKVAGADVVVTNPVHVAVALRYKQNEMKTPVLVAKGQRLWAERIKSIAEENHIPVVDNPELAWQLYRTVPVNTDIPPELYRPVAEVLAFVYNLKRRRRYVAGFVD